MFVYTVIGAKVDTTELKERIEEFITEGKSISLKEVMRQEGLVHVEDEWGSAYVCTRSHSFEAQGNRLTNYGPPVIYQDSNWDKDKVKEFLEPLELWMPRTFGVWTFVVWPLVAKNDGDTK